MRLLFVPTRLERRKFQLAIEGLQKADARVEAGFLTFPSIGTSYDRSLETRLARLLFLFAVGDDVEGTDGKP